MAVNLACAGNPTCSRMTGPRIGSEQFLANIVVALILGVAINAWFHMGGAIILVMIGVFVALQSVAVR
jgi:hypothetical protein